MTKFNQWTPLAFKGLTVGPIDTLNTEQPYKRVVIPGIGSTLTFVVIYSAQR